MVETKEVEGGFLIPVSDQFGGKWARESNRLDFDSVFREKLKHYIPEGAFVIDAGACIGTYTKSFSELVGAGGLVAAIEPCRENFEILRHNCARLKHENIFLVQKALAHRSGFGVCRYTDQNVGESRFEMRLSAGDTPVTSIDEFCRELTTRKLDFLKLDIEGWEFFALVGGFNIIRRDRPVIFTEINENCLLANGCTGSGVMSLLEMLGYAFKPVQENIPDGGVYDLICLPTK